MLPKPKVLCNQAYPCDKYYSVFAPGTLGISPDIYPHPVSKGFGERHIKMPPWGL